MSHLAEGKLKSKFIYFRIHFQSGLFVKENVKKATVELGKEKISLDLTIFFFKLQCFSSETDLLDLDLNN